MFRMRWLFRLLVAAYAAPPCAVSPMRPEWADSPTRPLPLDRVGRPGRLTLGQLHRIGLR